MSISSSFADKINIGTLSVCLNFLHTVSPSILGSIISKSIKSGFINIIDTTKLGEIVKEIGGGRETKEDVIDYGVGIVLSQKLGDYVEKDEELLKIYLNKKDMEIRKILSCFQIDKEKSKQDPLVYELIM